MLNDRNPGALSGFQKQVYQRFFEILEDESGFTIQRATSLDAWLEATHPEPDIVICAPFPEMGNLAPGLAELGRIRDRFPTQPLIIWSTRDEAAVAQTARDDYGAVAYYQGSLLDAPEDFADLILEYMPR
ncbi:MAG: hypothetical protein ACLFTK_16455 [Anaerolineales bacterium]